MRKQVRRRLKLRRKVVRIAVRIAILMLPTCVTLGISRSIIDNTPTVPMAEVEQMEEKVTVSIRPVELPLVSYSPVVQKYQSAIMYDGEDVVSETEQESIKDSEVKEETAEIPETEQKPIEDSQLNQEKVEVSEEKQKPVKDSEVKDESIEVPKVECEETPDPIQEQGFSQYKSEEYLLAQIIHCEVGNCSKEEMGWAGSVVINRARTGYRDFKDVNTIKEVLYQGYGTKMQQYGRYTIQKIEKGIVPSEDALEVAKGLINGTIPCLDESVLGQVGTKPTWRVNIVDLPGAHEIYWSPVDFETYRNSLK